MSTTMHKHSYQAVSSTLAERDAKVSFAGPVGTYFRALRLSFFPKLLFGILAIHTKLFLLEL